MGVETLLSAHRLTKPFGGLAAVNEVSIDLWQDRIHVVIGPNGAGKSTLTNLLSGDLPPTSGRIELAGQDITRAAPEQISRHGLGRSYQKTNIFAPFTVWENVRLAAQSRAPQQPWPAALVAQRAGGPCRQRARRGRAGARGPGRAPPHHRWRRQPRRAAPARVAMTLATEPACCCWTSRWPAWARPRPSAWSSCCCASSPGTR
jgi:branched-chain amino acid transport system ATP-binding protein